MAQPNMPPSMGPGGAGPGAPGGPGAGGPPGGPGMMPGGDTTKRKLFVGGLSYSTTDESLGAYFNTFGKTIEAVVIRDRATGKSKGYGFVTYETEEDAQRALEQPQPVIDGRRTNVNLAALGAKRPHHTFGGGYGMGPGFQQQQQYGYYGGQGGYGGGYGGYGGGYGGYGGYGGAPFSQAGYGQPPYGGMAGYGQPGQSAGGMPQAGGFPGAGAPGGGSMGGGDFGGAGGNQGYAGAGGNPAYNGGWPSQ